MRKITLLALIAFLPAMAQASTFEVTPGLFADQSTQNDGAGSPYMIMTSRLGIHGDADYRLGLYFFGVTYDYGIVDSGNYSGNNSENKETLQWAAPTVGITYKGFRFKLGWILYAFDEVYNQPSGMAPATYDYTQGTGLMGSVSYRIDLSPVLYLEPIVDLYGITFASGAVSGHDYEVSGVAPFLGFGAKL